MSGRTEDESTRWLVALNKVRKTGTLLLDQQLWCWGQDIRRVDGNALLAYGFTRHRPPEGEHGSPAYEWRGSGRSRVILWGFGFFYGDGDSHRFDRFRSPSFGFQNKNKRAVS